MSDTYSLAAKKRWRLVSPEERSKRASLASRARWAKASHKDKKENANRLLKSRNLL